MLVLNSRVFLPVLIFVKTSGLLICKARIPFIIPEDRGVLRLQGFTRCVI
uniref:Uncharacterized protein n=1 Tax=Candidatus Kentrum sp. TUN TaxID=2126343 RepID=A0A451A5A0_9GAMM|nr:MAG: hypothetical protein BECKTUN1418F_GA0071002_10646 [Candidatus Kentron sp. TUN]VFK61219.1 MAG: hypothetical protein BECKTUN1418E_GA0071001_10636 [Candidatus Kentron sp. TUN]VFK62407.1 MAG: hypothetical protein BECKTUN1418D_GA0071000_11755 [Candidatus Kentron sp. TUN]